MLYNSIGSVRLHVSQVISEIIIACDSLMNY